MKSVIDDWRIVIFLCLTLGLAPYFPEPHLWGKLRWILGGARGMGVMDWFDVAFHGLPWILLLRLLGKKLGASR
ncbi:hypothetical protein [Robiginitalea marina]|uniref:RND transporter n=1 Tax=Robiginitalea marina TaxID=2954105 RepID=A0ABT1AZ18_9FLAO|nr:hypothetical protein [Robiginitalea marina]MCO5724882.1 hypothetical protein [Robiginitalea marina]